MDTTELARRVATLSTEQDAEEVAAIISDCEALARAAREAKATISERLIDWIDENGELTIGETRYYVGTQTRRKLPDRLTAFEALLESVEGDVAAIGEVLAASPFKWAALREALGEERFGEVVEEERVPDLRTGKPKRIVKTIPEAMVQTKQEGR